MVSKYAATVILLVVAFIIVAAYLASIAEYLMCMWSGPVQLRVRNLFTVTVTVTAWENRREMEF